MRIFASNSIGVGCLNYALILLVFQLFILFRITSNLVGKEIAFGIFGVLLIVCVGVVCFLKYLANKANKYLVKDRVPYASFSETELTIYHYNKCKFITIPYTEIIEVSESEDGKLKMITSHSKYGIVKELLSSEDLHTLVEAINTKAKGFYMGKYMTE